IWFEPSGKEMSDEAWNAGFVRCLGVQWDGQMIGELDEQGQRIAGDSLLLLLNAHHEPIPFTLPPHGSDQHWELLLNTTNPSAEDQFLSGGQVFALEARSLSVFRLLQLEVQK